MLAHASDAKTDAQTFLNNTKQREERRVPGLFGTSRKKKRFHYCSSCGFARGKKTTVMNHVTGSCKQTKTTASPIKCKGLECAVDDDASPFAHRFLSSTLLITHLTFTANAITSTYSAGFSPLIMHDQYREVGNGISGDAIAAALASDAEPDMSHYHEDAMTRNFLREAFSITTDTDINRALELAKSLQVIGVISQQQRDVIDDAAQVVQTLCDKAIASTPVSALIALRKNVDHMAPDDTGIDDDGACVNTKGSKVSVKSSPGKYIKMMTRLYVFLLTTFWDHKNLDGSVACDAVRLLCSYPPRPSPSHLHHLVAALIGMVLNVFNSDSTQLHSMSAHNHSIFTKFLIARQFQDARFDSEGHIVLPIPCSSPYRLAHDSEELRHVLACHFLLSNKTAVDGHDDARLFTAKPFVSLLAILTNTGRRFSETKGKFYIDEDRDPVDGKLISLTMNGNCLSLLTYQVAVENGVREIEFKLINILELNTSNQMHRAMLMAPTGRTNNQLWLREPQQLAVSFENSLTPDHIFEF